MFNHKNYVFGNQNISVPAHLNFGKHILDFIKLKTDEVALVHSETHEKLTYKDLTRYAVNLAVSLTKLGVKVGDTVAVGSEKRIELIPVMLGVTFTGAAVTCFNLKSGFAVLKHQLTISKPKYFLCSKSFWIYYKNILSGFDGIEAFVTFDDNVESLISIKTTTNPPPIEPLDTNNVNNMDLFEPAPVQGQTDIAYIGYSSGTTGMPKGVPLTHLNCIFYSLTHGLDDDSAKTVLLCGYWYNTYDLFATYKFLTLGKRIVYFDNVPCFPKSFQDYQVNIAQIIPSLVGVFVKLDELNELNFDSLKTIYCCGAPLHSKTIKKVKERMPKLENIFQGYGMSETGYLASEFWGSKGCKPGSVGVAAPGVTLKVVDPETLKTLGPNQQGEIFLRNSVRMNGYIGIDLSTLLDDEGFFGTGDLGYYDDDGYFFIIDRLKEIINYNGANIAPVELETILQLHPGVKEAGVVGKPVPDFGEEPTAFVVRQSDSKVTEKELIDYVSVEVPPYMQLRGGVKFLDKLPRNIHGKLVRRQLREMLNE